MAGSEGGDEEQGKAEQGNGKKKKKKEAREGEVGVSRVNPPSSPPFFVLLKGSISPDTISRIPGSLILNQNH